MYVCLCKGVSNRTIRSCLDDGARSLEEVGRRCGAGTACGSCRLDIDGMLRDARAARAGNSCARSSEQLAAK